MSKFTIAVFFTSILLVGCVSGIDSVDTKDKNQDCVRQCTGIYSACIGSAFGIAAQNNCAGGFRACSNSCPNR